MNIRNITIVSLLLAALLAGVFLSKKNEVRPEYRAATVLPAANALPEFSLTDQFGDEVNADIFLGQWHLVFFGFTHCPDICPTTLQQLSRVKQQLGEVGVDVSPRIVLVSVDPERDSADVIGQYVKYFGDDNLGVTGDLQELQKLTSGLGIYFAKQSAVDGQAGYNVDHSSAVLLLDPDGKFHALFSGNPTVDDYVHDLSLIFDRVPLAVTGPRFLQPLPGSTMSVGYLTLSNSSNDDIEITSVSSEQFDSVQIHETLQQDGVAKMRRVEKLVIAAESSVTLREGGMHLMFHGRRNADDVIAVKLFSNDVLALQISARLTLRDRQ